MVNDAGQPIPGVLPWDAKTWKPTTMLGFGRTHTVTIAECGGMPQTSTSPTLAPNNRTQMYLNGTRTPKANA